MRCGSRAPSDCGRWAGGELHREVREALRRGLVHRSPELRRKGNRSGPGRVRTGVDLDLPFRGSDAVRAGVVGRRGLQGPHFRMLGPDVHIRSTTVVDVRVRSLAALVRHPGGVVTGLAAAAAWGVWEGEVERIDVLLDRRVRVVDDLIGARGVRDRWAGDEVVERDGLRVTTTCRTVYDVARRCPLPTAVAVVDAMARVHGVVPAEVRELSARYPRARGRLAVEPVLASGNPGSPDAATSMLRARLADHVRERARVAPVLEVAGRAVRPVLAWDVEKVAVFGERESAAARDGIAWLRRAGWWIAPPDATAIRHVLDRAAVARAPVVWLTDEDLDVDEWEGV